MYNLSVESEVTLTFFSQSAVIVMFELIFKRIQICQEKRRPCGHSIAE